MDTKGKTTRFPINFLFPSIFNTFCPSLDFCWLLDSLLCLIPAGFHILPSPYAVSCVILFFPPPTSSSSKSPGFSSGYSLCAVTFPDPFFSVFHPVTHLAFSFVSFSFFLVNQEARHHGPRNVLGHLQVTCGVGETKSEHIFGSF